VEETALSLEKLSEKVYTWCRYSEGLGYDLNGYYLSSDEGNLLVDPPGLTDDEADEIESLGEPQLLVITNHTHWRQAPVLLERWDVPVAAHEMEAPRLPRVDRTLTDGERLPGGWRVLFVPGKTRGEVALYTDEEGGILLVGDTLIGEPAGRVRLLPDAKLEDKAALLVSLGRLSGLEFGTLLVGDGQSILHGAGPVVREFIQGVIAPCRA
jgi:glyoxylase-like metal-dependent hydrolase (beta-lactamase superfamily II)